jgi:hypothetical protein
MMIRPSIFVVASVIGALSPLAALAATRLQAQGPPAPAWDQHVAESAARQLELGARPSATTPLAARRSGAASCACTRRSRR